MKKIFLSLTALLAFGIASAQTTNSTTNTTAQPKNKSTSSGMNDKTDVKGPIVQKDATRSGADGEMIQPRKDEVKTTDHVKSTPTPNTMKDTTTTKNAKRPRKVKKA